ncbi:MAG: RNA polymerase sigma factor [Bacteroidia bacterium]|nr:RNA polymerase sigma factor [Bacteroidia bacterium]
MNSRKSTQADKLLWTSFLAGDEKALSDIVNKYHSKLVCVLLRYTCNETELEDLISEIFIWLMESQTRLKDLEVRNLSAFLIEIGKKMYFSKSKKARRRQEILAQYVKPYVEKSVSPYGLDAAYVADIQQMIQGVSHPARRRILQLLSEGYDAQEISEAFGKTPKWAHQNIYLARRELKSIMGMV